MLHTLIKQQASNGRRKNCAILIKQTALSDQNIAKLVISEQI